MIMKPTEALRAFVVSLVSVTLSCQSKPPDAGQPNKPQPSQRQTKTADSASAPINDGAHTTGVPEGPHPIPSTDLKQLVIEPHTQGRALTVRVHNETEWYIKELLVEVTGERPVGLAELELELAANKKLATEYVLKHFADVDKVRELKKVGKPIPAGLVKVAEEWRNFNDRDRELKEQVAQVKGAAASRPRRYRLVPVHWIPDPGDTRAGEREAQERLGAPTQLPPFTNGAFGARLFGEPVDRVSVVIISGLGCRDPTDCTR
jgi:hypothetical protein